MFHINKFLVLLFPTLAMLPIKAQAYNIEDAILSAYVKNDALKSQREQLEAVKLEKTKALTEFMPSVVATTKFANNKPRLAALKSSTNKNSRNSTLALSLDLFTGGSTIAKLNIADRSIKASVAQYQNTLNDITYKVIESYQNIIFAREYYQISLHNEEFKADVLKKANIKFKMGEEVKTAVVNAKAELAAAVAQRESASNQIQDAIANFVYLVGEMPPESMETINTKYIKLPDALDKLSVSVSRNNPLLIKAKNESEQAKKNIDLAFSELSPSLKFIAQSTRSNSKKYVEKEQTSYVKHQTGVPSYNVEFNDPVNPTRITNINPVTNVVDTYMPENKNVTVPNPNNQDSKTVALELTVPIFQKGLEYVKISEAKKKAKSAEYAFKNVEGETQAQTIQAWNKYHSTKHQLYSLKEATIFYEEAVSGEKEKYEAGASTITDLLDIQNKQKEQKIKHLKASHEHKLSIFEIRKLMGDIHKVNYGIHKPTMPSLKDEKNKKSTDDKKDIKKS